MTCYEKIADEMNLESFYRFQGYLSYNYFDRNKNLIYGGESQETKYIYLSKSLRHHQYYMRKRIIQLINREILKESSFQLTPKTLQNLSYYREILQYIKNYQEPLNINSIELNFCPVFLNLIQGNGITNMMQKRNRKIEIVDYKKNGGGYGFCDDWLRLLNHLTIFYRFRKITLEDIVSIVNKYRMIILYGRTFKSDLSRQTKSNLKVNPSLFNDFAKYDIIEIMERLCESTLIEPSSPFGKTPTNMIKDTIKEFETSRTLVKNKLEAYYLEKY